ncbi:NADPH-dependent FMN reductase [Kurthia senegalensis]|uniref:NADPH-dependent FMN reductase n=1 Tax=Kurthia senegalensis TaxID=1033740 RepID=UPI000287D394|nr:NADPH-dependent FMN reductase [Kurthia senegalensis]
MKIVGIVGSVRKQSFNKMLANYVATRFADKFELDVLTLEDLPLYNQDIENEAPQAVKQFKARVAEADAVIWFTPEYNGTMPGVLVNAIDWLSRVDKVMVGKPSLVMGASMGALGTVKAQGHLYDVLRSPGIDSPFLAGSYQVVVGSVHTKFDENGQLTDAATEQFLHVVTDQFVTFVQKQQGK